MNEGMDLAAHNVSLPQALRPGKKADVMIVGWFSLLSHHTCQEYLFIRFRSSRNRPSYLLACSLCWKAATSAYETACWTKDACPLQVTLEWVSKSRQHSKFRYFMFLNSSVRGPFVPSYMPQGWHWYQAFTERLRGDVAGISSSLVCLPDADAGGPGPKMESWAFALNREGRLTSW